MTFVRKRMIEAIRQGDATTVAGLIGDGCPVVRPKWDLLGFVDSPVIEAAWHRRDAILRMLLESGANPNERDRRRLTPLAIAAKWGSTDSLELLLAFGADVHVGHEMALQYACISCRTGTVRILLDHGANATVASARISLFRLTGDVLRLLQSRGATLPDAVDTMLRTGAALGDWKPPTRDK